MHHAAPPLRPGQDEPEPAADEPVGQQVVGPGVDHGLAPEPELEERDAVPHRAVPGEGGVFTPDLIETWIDLKRTNEIDPLRLRPHPYEFALYYDG